MSNKPRKTHLVRDLGDEYTLCGIPCTRLGRFYELRRVVRGSGEAYDCKFCILRGGEPATPSPPVTKHIDHKAAHEDLLVDFLLVGKRLEDIIKRVSQGTSYMMGTDVYRIAQDALSLYRQRHVDQTLKALVLRDGATVYVTSGPTSSGQATVRIDGNRILLVDEANVEQVLVEPYPFE